MKNKSLKRIGNKKIKKTGKNKIKYGGGGEQQGNSSKPTSWFDSIFPSKTESQVNPESKSTSFFGSLFPSKTDQQVNELAKLEEELKKLQIKESELIKKINELKNNKLPSSTSTVNPNPSMVNPAK